MEEANRIIKRADLNIPVYPISTYREIHAIELREVEVALENVVIHK